MEELITKNTKCPNCNHDIEYWTKSNHIECINCKNMIAAEPCKDVKIIEEEIEVVEGEVIEYVEEV